MREMGLGKSFLVLDFGVKKEPKVTLENYFFGESVLMRQRLLKFRNYDDDDINGWPVGRGQLSPQVVIG